MSVALPKLSPSGEERCCIPVMQQQRLKTSLPVLHREPSLQFPFWHLGSVFVISLNTVTNQITIRGTQREGRLTLAHRFGKLQYIMVGRALWLWEPAEEAPP